MREVGCDPGAEDPVGTPRFPHGAGLWAAAVLVCVGGLRQRVGPLRAR